MVQMGNHERNWVNGRREEDSSGHSGHYTWDSLNSTSSGGECGIPTAKRFSMPGNWQDRWATRVPGVWGAVSRRRDCHSAVPPLSLQWVSQYGWEGVVSKMTVSPTAIGAVDRATETLNDEPWCATRLCYLCLAHVYAEHNSAAR